MHAYRLHKHVEILLSALVNGEVVTREKLLEVWKADPKCKVLLQCYIRYVTCSGTVLSCRFAEGLLDVVT